MLTLWTGTDFGNDAIDGHFGNDTANDIANDDETDVLMLNGTTGNDTMLFSQQLGANGQVRFDFNGSVRTLTMLSASGSPLIDQFQIAGLAGNDTIGFVTADTQLPVGMTNPVATGLSQALDLSALATRSRDFVSRFTGDSGNDLLIGGAGRDSLDGGLGSDVIYGFAGDDRLWGDRGIGAAADHDVMFGGQGNDDVLGGSGKNTIYAWSIAPETRLVPTPGASFSFGDVAGLISGGPTANFGVYVERATGKLQLDDGDLNDDGVLDAGVDATGSNEPFNLEVTGLNRTLGGERNDHLFGGTTLDFLYGNGGNDVLFRANGTTFESMDGGLAGDEWKEYARESDQIWYVGGTNADDEINVDFVTEPGLLADHHLVTRLTNNNGNFSFAAQVRLDFTATDGSGNLVWDPRDRVVELDTLLAAQAAGDTKAVDGMLSGLQIAQTNLINNLLPGEGDFLVILIDALGGNDQVEVGPTVQKSVWVDGGAGDDRVEIRTGNAILTDKAESSHSSSGLLGRNDLVTQAFALTAVVNGTTQTFDGQTVTTGATFTGLTIDNPQDVDWYKFTLSAATIAAAKIELASGSPIDNLGLALFTINGDGTAGTQLNTGTFTTSGNAGSISLSGLAENTPYLLKVTSPNIVPTIYDVRMNLSGTSDAAQIAAFEQVKLSLRTVLERSDVILGGTGDDILRGGAGEDWIFGGAGNDVLTGGTDRGASDLLFAGTGNDTFQIIPDGLPLLGNQANTQFDPATRTYTPTFNDEFFGGDGDDRVLFLGGDTDRRGFDVPDFAALRYDTALHRYEFSSLVWDIGTQAFRTTTANEKLVYQQEYLFYQTRDVEQTQIETRSGRDVVHADPGFQFLPIQASGNSFILDPTANASLFESWGIERGASEQGATEARLLINGGDDDVQGDAGADRLYGYLPPVDEVIATLPVVFAKPGNFPANTAAERFEYSLAAPYLGLKDSTRPGIDLNDLNDALDFNNDALAVQGSLPREQLSQLTPVGDFNGDQRDDFLITGVNHSYLVFGPLDVTDVESAVKLANIVIDHDAIGRPGERFGDVNGDGYADLAFVRDDNGDALVTIVLGGPTGGLQAGKIAQWPRAWDASFVDSFLVTSGSGSNARTIRIGNNLLSDVGGVTVQMFETTGDTNDDVLITAGSSYGSQIPGVNRYHVGYVFSGQKISSFSSTSSTPDLTAFDRLATMDLAQTDPLAGSLVHRYSFNEIPGSGATLVDSVGGANAIVVDGSASGSTSGGGGTSRNGSSIRMYGGAAATSDYIELPDNLLSGLTDATFEFWATRQSVQYFARIFDFGANTNDFFAASWSLATDGATDGIYWWDGVNNDVPNIMATYTNGQEFHLAFVVDQGGGAGGTTRVSAYKNGVFKGSLDTANTLPQLTANNNWLGRSKFSDNNVADASYNEFRVYNRVLTGTEIAANTTSGPDYAFLKMVAPTTLNTLVAGDVNGDGRDDVLFGNASIDVNVRTVTPAVLTASLTQSFTGANASLTITLNGTAATITVPTASGDRVTSVARMNAEIAKSVLANRVRAELNASNVVRIVTESAGADVQLAVIETTTTQFGFNSAYPFASGTETAQPALSLSDPLLTSLPDNNNSQLRVSLLASNTTALQPFALGDLNRDGYNDVGLGSLTDLKLYYGTANAATILTGVDLTITGADLTATGGDFDGDGQGDLAVTGRDSGNSRLVMPGTVVFDAISTQPNGATLTLAQADAAMQPNGIDRAFRGLKYDGSNDAAYLPNTTINGLTEITTAFWFRTTKSQENFLNGAKAEDGGFTDNEYTLFHPTGDMLSIAFHGVVYHLPGVPTFNDGEWHHLAVTTHDAADRVDFFLDGGFVGSLNVPIYSFNISENFLVLGMDIDAGGVFNTGFANGGDLADLSFWSRPLSLAEIQAIRDGQMTGAESDLRAWFKLDETSGTALIDSTGKNANGVLGSSVVANSTPTRRTVYDPTNSLSVAPALDLNNDGLSDLVIGTAYASTSPFGAGRLNVIYGRRVAAALPDQYDVLENISVPGSGSFVVNRSMGQSEHFDLGGQAFGFAADTTERWFQFTTLGDGKAGDAIHLNGPVRMDLIDTNGGVLLEDHAAISLRDIEAGTYYLRVFAPGSISEIPYSESIPLGNLFDDANTVSLDVALSTDTFRATADIADLGVDQVLQAGSATLTLNSASTVTFNLTNTGWENLSNALPTNDAVTPISSERVISTVGTPSFNVTNSKLEDGIGIHANGVLTFDLNELRAAAGLPIDASYRFLVDRAGTNDGLLGSLRTIAIVSNDSGVLSGYINGQQVAVTDTAGTWAFSGTIPAAQTNATGKVSYDVLVPGNARYLSLIATSAGNGLSNDTAVFSGARLSAQSFTIDMDAPIRGQTHETSTLPDGDVIDGGDGDDTINGGTGLDRVLGSSGSDTFVAELVEIRDQSIEDNLASDVPSSETSFGNNPLVLDPVIGNFRTRVFFDDFEAASIDSERWTKAGTPTLDGVGLGEPSGVQSARFNGNLDVLTSKILNLSDATRAELTYSFEQTGDRKAATNPGESPDPNDDLIVEYTNNNGSTWIELERQLGKGSDMVAFNQRTLVLPPAALRSTFQFRIKALGTAGAYDDWFVDNVSVTALSDGSTELRNAIATAIGDPVTLGAADSAAFSLDFDGMNDYAQVPFDAALNPAGDFSIELWAKVEGGSGTYRSAITSRDNLSNQWRGYMLYASAGNQWQFWTGNGAGAFDILQGPSITLNQWTHIAISFDDITGTVNGNGARTGTKSLYINGQLVAQALGTYEANTQQPLRIGGGRTETVNDYSFNGLLDEVRVWNTARTVNEIEDNYRSTISSASTGLVGYYQLDNGIGSTATDIAGTANNATLNNGPAWSSTTFDQQGLLHHDLTASDYASLTSVDASSRGIADLSTVEYLVNVRSLDLSDNNLDDADLNTLLPRRLTTGTQAGESVGLAQLEDLDLTDNHALTSIGKLVAFPELQSLKLEGTSVDPNSTATLTTLGAMPGLETLTLPTGVLAPGQNLVTREGNAVSMPYSFPALEFDATDVIDIGTAEKLGNLTNNFTVGAWMRPDRAAGGVILATKGNVGGWVLEHNQPDIIKFATFGRNDYSSNSVSLPIGQWCHVAATMDSTNAVEFFVNGVSIGKTASRSLPGIPTSNGFNIGAAAAFGSYFDGAIAEVGVWGRVLTASEIQLARASSPADVSANLVGYWPLNEGSGSLADDRSSSGHEGTILGATWTQDSSAAWSVTGATTASGTSSPIAFSPTDDGTALATVRNFQFPLLVRNVAPTITQTPNLGLANDIAGVREGQTIAVANPRVIGSTVEYDLTVNGEVVDQLVVSDPSTSDLTQMLTRFSVTNEDHQTTDLTQAALTFAGTGYVDTGLVVDQGPTSGGATFESWIKPTALVGNRFVFDTAGSNGSGWALYHNGSTWWIDTGSTQFDTTVAVTFGSWQHLAVVFDSNGSVKFYRNGAPAGATTTNIGFNAAGGRLNIGGDYTGQSSFSGGLDEFRVWDRALSAAEVATLDDGGVAATSPNLIGSWSFNEGAAGIADDSSVRGNDGRFRSVLTPTAVLASSNDASWATATHLIDGSGLTVTTPIENSTHTNGFPDGGGSFTFWHTAGGDPIANAFVRFDLGATYDLTDMLVWQSNAVYTGGDQTDRGVKQYDLLVGSTTSNLQQIITDAQLVKAGGTDAEPAQSIRLTGLASGVRYIRLEIDSNYGGPFVGLSEVIFLGTPNLWSTDVPLAASFIVADNGTYTLTAHVNDQDGGTDSATFSFNASNVAPTINDLHASSATGVVGTKLTFDARNVTDPGVNDTRTYLWSVTTDNGQAVPPSDNIEFDFTPLYAGTYIVTLTVTDKDGAATSQSQTFNVNPVAVVSGTPAASVAVGSLVTLDAFASSTLAPQGALVGTPQNVTREFAWTFSPNVGIISGNTAHTFRFVPTATGAHSVTLTITDVFTTDDVPGETRLSNSQTVNFTTIAAPALGISQAPLIAPEITNGGFETPVLNENEFFYLSTLTPQQLSALVWTQTVGGNGTALSRNVSSFQNGGVLSPEGQQLVALQTLPGIYDAAGLTQTVNGFEIGQPHAISLLTMACGGVASNGSDLEIVLDVGLPTEQKILEIDAVDFTTFTSVSSNVFIALKDSYTVTVRATANGGLITGDHATLIDDVRVVRLPAEGDTVTLNPGNLSPLPQVNGASVGSREYLWHVTSTNDQSITDGTADSFAFVPTDEGTYTATLTITDTFGGLTITHSEVSTITVANAAPTFVIDGDATLIPGSPNDLLVRFTDPGAADTFTFSINWGDGVTDSDSATSTTSDAGRVGTIPGSHTYASQGNKTVTITVSDANSGTLTRTFTILDLTVPAADVVDVTPDPRKTNAGVVTINFSEPVSGVDISDFVLTLSGVAVDISGLSVTQVTDSQYTLNLSSVTMDEGVYELTLAAAGSSIQDTVGNLLAVSTTDSWTIDTTAPTATLPDFGATPLDRATGTATITFSEAVTGFDLSDVSLTRNGSNVSLSGLTLMQVSDTEFSLDLSTVAAMFGNYELAISGSDGIQDLATNAMAAVTSSWAIEQVAPAATISFVGDTPRQTDIGEVSITFSENVTDFDLADLSLTYNGSNVSLTGLTLVELSPSEYTIDLSSVTAAEGDYVLTLTASGSDIQDRVTNAMSVNATTNWIVDTTAPIVDIVDVSPDPRLTEVGLVTITFSEPVSGLTLADLALVRDGATLDLTGTPITALSATQYQIDLTNFTRFEGTTLDEEGQEITVSGMLPGHYTLTVSAVRGSIVDDAGNVLTAGASDSFVIDLSGPTAEIDGLPTSPINTTVGLVTITFDEAVSGVDLNDFALTCDEATISLAGVPFVAVNSTTYTLNLSSVTSLGGRYQLTLNGDGSGIADSLGNVIAGDAIGTFDIDMAAPTATLTIVTPNPRSSAVGVLTVTFSEPVSGVDLSDFSLTLDEGPVDLSGVEVTQISESRYEIDLSGLTSVSGVFEFSLNTAEAGIEDVAGNVFATDLSTSWTTDTTAPQAMLSDVSPNPRNTAVGVVSVTFLEEASGLDISDFTLHRDGAPVDLSALTVMTVGPTEYTLDLSSVTTEAGDYQLTLRANGSEIVNASSTSMLEDAGVSWTTDTTAPTGSLSSDTPSITNSVIGVVTIEFSENVTGLDLEDFTLTRDGEAISLTDLIDSLPGATLMQETPSRFTLDLSRVTGTAGEYILSLPTDGSDIGDAAGNELVNDLSLTITIDTTAPTASIEAVTPDPRQTDVDSLTINLSEPVSGLDIADFTLTRNGDLVSLLDQSLTLLSETQVSLSLAGLTNVDGEYVLTLNTATAKITDAAGNLLTSDAIESWTRDTLVPTASIAEITPEPRSTAVEVVTIQFSEPVSGFDLADLSLSRGGQTVDLSGLTLNSVDASEYTIDLSSVTGIDADYVLTLTALGSGIVDAAGLALASNASDAWHRDSIAPTVDIVNVEPNPRLTAVDMLVIEFSEPVSGFDLEDLRLTLNGELVGLAGLTLAATTATRYELSVAGLTTTDGLYELTLTTAGSGIQDDAGNTLVADATEEWAQTVEKPSVPQDTDSGANSVFEAAATGTAVGLTAFSIAPGAVAVEYSLSDDAGGRFSIHPITGIVTVANGELIDEDTATSHTVTVVATRPDIGKSSSRIFTIRVRNVAPLAPVDADSAANVVAEGAANDSPVGITVISSDPAGGRVTYRLTDNAGGRFAINRQTGIVTVANGDLLNHDTATSHAITVIATDVDGFVSPAQSFTIQVANVAPASPSDIDATENLVAENSPIGTLVGVTASSSDPNGGIVTFSLSNDAGGRFRIGESTGVVTVANASLLDFESASSHSISIVATDASGAASSQSFTIGVTNIAPAAPDDGNIAANTVAEAAANGTLVGITATNRDPAGGTVTFSLSDSAGGRFAINSSSGVVTVANGGLLDHDTTASHSITVVASDSGGLSTSQSFTINVMNVAPATPSDADNATNTVLENSNTGTLVGLTASSGDPGGGTVVYSLSDNAGGRFAIDSSTGAVSVANGGLLDFETSSSHSITIVATDASGVAASRSFTIGVADVPELLRISANDWGNGSLTLSRSGTLIRVRRSDTQAEVASTADTAIAGVEFTGRDGANDELVIDFTGGSPLTGTVTFAGGTGSDTVRLTGLSTTATSIAYDLTTAGAVSMSINADAFTSTNIERFLDSLNAADRSITFGDANDQISLSNVGAANDGQTQLSHTGGAIVEFKNPTNRLTVNLAGGQDSMDVNAVDALFTSGLQINGGNGADTLINNLTRGITLNGDADNDVLRGGTGADTLNGGADQDTLEGKSGSDALLGGTGNDVYVFAATSAAETDTLTELTDEGTDRLDFGLLTIVATVNLTNDATLATHANRTLKTAAAGQAANFENVTGGTGADMLTGNAANNLLEGGAGNDMLAGGLGNDTLIGGAGGDSMLGGANDDLYLFMAAVSSESDTIIELTGEGFDALDFSALAVTVPVNANLASTTTTLATHTNRTVKVAAIANLPFFEHLIGGAGNDVLKANGGAQRIEGRAGNDSITGGAGSDSLIGGQGDDVYLFAAATVIENDTITELAGEGADRLDFTALTATTSVTVNLGNDATLATHANRTVVAAAAGQSANIENATGGAANDSLAGNATNNQLDGGAGLDTLNGAGGNDTLIGGAGNDALLGGLGNDVFSFAAASSAEIDTLTELASEGTDRLDFSLMTSTLVVTVNLASDTAMATHTNRTVVTAAAGQAANFENITGGAAADKLTGNTNGNVLEGGAGNDILAGGAGPDTLVGGAGNDAMLGGLGDNVYVFAAAAAAETDTLTELPGEGADRLDFSALTATIPVTVDLSSDANLAKHTNRVVKTAVIGQAANFEHATGGAGNDVLAGNAANNRLEGGAGNDVLRGGTGSDTILGRDGNDTIDGGTGNDVLLGEAGVDSIIGGLDNDAISGGNDNDILNGNEGNDSIVGGTGADSLLGGAGTGIDLLIGEDGDDTLAGEDGQDSLDGGSGTNSLVNTTNGTPSTLDDDIIGIFTFNIDELLD